MDFNLSEDQHMLADLVARFVEREYDFEQRRTLARTPTGFSEEHWRALAGMGMMALNVPESWGGIGHGPIETMIVMEGIGRGLVLEPFLPTAVVGASLIAKLGTAEQCSRLLPRIADGTMRLAVATNEPSSRFDLWHVRTSATPHGKGWRIQGRKAVVLAGGSADQLIVPARTSGADEEKGGISLFLVDAHAAGLKIRDFPSIDGSRCAELELGGVVVGEHALLGTLDEGYAPLEWGVDRGIAALCAEAVGAMDQLVSLTAEYLKTRKQFGQPLAAFQSLQHRVADMQSAVEQARALMLMATAKVDTEDLAERRRAVSAAKAVAGRSGRFIGQQAVQLHGGMGMTDELSVGYYFKRLTCIDMTWGDTEHHVELYSPHL